MQVNQECLSLPLGGIDCCLEKVCFKLLPQRVTGTGISKLCSVGCVFAAGKCATCDGFPSRLSWLPVSI